jgi:tRNA G10  N-methylase Trm11
MSIIQAICFDCNSIDWRGLYKSNWSNLIVPAAYSHPAKFARGLIEKIYAFGREKGYWQEGSVICDPFGGVGLGGIVSLLNGYTWAGVELEARFVDLANQNFKHIQDRYGTLVKGQATIVQGDSRKLREVIGRAVVDGIVTSPPWEESHSQSTCENPSLASQGRRRDGKPRGGSLVGKGYGHTPGQLGTMKEGQIDSVITSPPWESVTSTEGDPKYAWKFHGNQKYGSTGGQIGIQTGDTYWSSVKQIYQECHALLKPGGVIVVVVKSFVRAGKIVNLPDMTLRLLESIGFLPLHYVRAWQVEKYHSQHKFNGDKDQRVIEHKGFFRRLHEKKSPGTRIDYEVVLFMRKSNES